MKGLEKLEDLDTIHPEGSMNVSTKIHGIISVYVKPFLSLVDKTDHTDRYLTSCRHTGCQATVCVCVQFKGTCQSIFDSSPLAEITPIFYKCCC